MDKCKGVAIGLLYSAIFFGVYFVVSLPTYWLVNLVFGETPFSERFMSGIPYLAMRGIQVAACAMAGTFAAAWVCGRMVNQRSALAAMYTFIGVCTAELLAIIFLGERLDFVEYIMALNAAAVGYFLGIDLMGKAVARNSQH